MLFSPFDYICLWICDQTKEENLTLKVYDEYNNVNFVLESGYQI